MHRSASESAEEKKGVIIEAEVRYVFRIPLVKVEFELIIEAEVRYVFRIPLVKIQENVRGGFVQRERALQQRRERFTDETTENREARLETAQTAVYSRC